jgi:predicted N-acetyltransferase YhbS
MDVVKNDENHSLSAVLNRDGFVNFRTLNAFLESDRLELVFDTSKKSMTLVAVVDPETGKHVARASFSEDELGYKDTVTLAHIEVFGSQHQNKGIGSRLDLP